MNSFVHVSPNPMLLLSLLIGLLLFSVSCEKIPSQPGYTNPFDPENPNTQGDPYNLSAALVDDGVLLTWQIVNYPDIMGYTIYRSEDGGPYAELNQTGPQENNFTDTDVHSGITYAYYIVAQTVSGEADSTSLNPAVIYIATDFATFPLGTTGENIAMILIPPGSILMGAGINEQGAGSDEYPRHVITFDEDFWLGKYEVSFDATSLASGVYLYRLSTGEFSASGKMVLMK